MLKKTVTIIFLFLFGVTLLAQNKTTLKPIGSSFIKGQNSDAVRITNKENRNTPSLKAPGPGVINNVAGLIDTLSYQKMLGINWDTQFTTNAQDVLIQWYKAPTDLIVHSAGFSIYANADGVNVSVKLVKFSRTLDEMLTAGTAWQGYYPSAGDGFNNIGGFPDEATGAWVSDSGYTDPFTGDYDLWSDGGFGWPVAAAPENAEGEYNWVDMSHLTGDPTLDPTVAKDEIFGIVVKNEGTTLGGNAYTTWAVANTTYRGWKLYENGRNITGATPPGDGGWWSRDYIWNFAAVVEYTGDLPPVITDLSRLLGTISTDARTVTVNIVDTNPSGGASGVASATLKYSVDGGTSWSDAAMTNTSGDTYSGDIPGQPAGSEVSYYVEAVDNNGNTAISGNTFTYVVFAPTSGIQTLVVFNGFDGVASGYPQDYYFGVDDFVDYATFEFDHDVWAYGPLPADAITTYKNIIEISNSNGGPTEYNNDVIADWIAAGADHNYMVAGQEWLGAGNGYTDVDYAAGDFEYDILGLTHSYNDITYDLTAGTGQELPSRVTPIQGSLLCDSLYLLFNSQPTDSLDYYPNFEIGGTIANWIDGFDVADGVDVDMNVESRTIGGDPNVMTLHCIAHHTLTAGNKVAFMSLDPLSLDTRAWADDGYYWYGFSSTAPQVQVLHWFGVNVVGVIKDNNIIPDKYSLSQNYPNPFNPTTLIKYSIPNAGAITLSVYDVLGRKVAELVNESQQAGSYNVTWDGTNQYGTKVTSGAYFYQLKTDNGFIETKKMILLK